MGRAAARREASASGTAAWTSPDSACGSARWRAARCSRATRVLLRDVRITSGGGDLAVGGAIRLENLSRPLFVLDLRASQFLAMDVRNFLTLTGTGNLSAARPAARRDAHRQPDGEQRRAVLRRPGEQARHRSRRSHHRRPGGQHADPGGGPRREVPEPVPRLAPDRRPAGGDRLRRLAPLRRGQHPARRRGAGEQGRAGVPARSARCRRRAGATPSRSARSPATSR